MNFKYFLRFLHPENIGEDEPILTSIYVSKGVGSTTNQLKDWQELAIYVFLGIGSKKFRTLRGGLTVEHETPSLVFERAF